MTLNKSLKVFAAFAAAATSGTGAAAFAATYTPPSVAVSAGTPLTTSGTTTGSYYVVTDGNLPNFDSSLGTLTGAVVTLTVTSASLDEFAHGGTGGPYSSYGQTITDKITPTLSITAPDAADFPYYGVTNSNVDPSATGTPVTYSVAIPASGSANPYVYVATMQVVGNSSPTTTLSDSYTLDASDLTSMTGPGTTDIQFYVEGNGSSSPNLPASGGRNVDNVTGYETITYTYTPVPEPASLGALGLGTVALIARRRK